MPHFKRFVRVALRLVALVVLGSVGLTGVLWAQHNRVVTLPMPTGPYAVGRIEVDWVDEKRIDPLATPAHQPRALPVWIWYPADPTTQGDEAPYLPAAWVRAREQDIGVGALLTQNPATVHAHARHGVPLSTHHQQYPVLVMQPGLGPILPDYTALAEALASDGYVVVGSTPPGSASVAVFADGRVVRGTAAGSVSDSASPSEAKQVLDRLITLWAADDQFILDQLERLNTADPSGVFVGRLDMDAVGLLGHSFGGATAAQVCRLDARCKAGVDLDGYPYGDVVQVGLKEPFMFVWSEPTDVNDQGWQQAVQDTQAMYAKIQHGGYQITIKGTRHFNFSDYALLFAPLLKLQGGIGSIDGQRGLAITHNYLHAFFDKYLEHADAPLLQGPAQAYPEVQFEAR